MRKTILATFCAFIAASGLSSAQTTTFTYQGRLNAAHGPASGLYDFTFNLHAQASGGSALPGPIVSNAVQVTNGLFAVPLNFGDQFSGADRWLEIAVRTNGGGAFTALVPRQWLTSTPQAIQALKAGTAVSATTASTANAVTPGGVNNAAIAAGAVDSSKIADGTVGLADLSGVVLSNTFWRLTGNAGTVPGVNFMGTTDSAELEIRANNTTALRINRINTTADPNLIGGFGGNKVDPGFQGAVIAGGGTLTLTNRIGGGNYSAIGGGLGNQVFGAGSAIAGGRVNQIGSNSLESAIGGGQRNAVGANSFQSTISGGLNNEIQTNASRATIGGGAHNKIQNLSREATIGGGNDNQINENIFSATIGGGDGNSIQSYANYATVSGGTRNAIQENSGWATISGGAFNNINPSSDNSTIAGGNQNLIQTNAEFASIGGGAGNTILPGANYATIPGGQGNSATNHAFAAGRRAKANHTGAFVWGDSTDQDFSTTSNNQFLVRAVGGFGINTNRPQDALHVNGPFIQVTGAGREGAYLGGDGASFDVQVGSVNPGVANVALWNRGNSSFMGLVASSIYANEVNVSGPAGLNLSGDITVNPPYKVNFGSSTRQMLNLHNADFGIGVQNDTLYQRTGNNFAWHRRGSHADAAGDPGPGGTNLMFLDANGELFVKSSLTLDDPGANDGTLRPGLLFGYGTGEGISSKRTAGGNQYGIDFYTGFASRMSIANSGNIGIGNTNPGKLLHLGNGFAESEGMIRFASRSNAASRVWDIGVPKTDETATGYSFVIDDTSRGANPEFIIKWNTGNVGIGTINPQSALHVAGIVTATAFNPSSDRNLKENFTRVSPREVLDKVAALPISRWNFKGDDATPHVGPMAQDFHAAFGLGTDERHIATVDADGVALAAIQGLNQKLEETREENAELKRELAEIKQLLRKLPATRP